MRRHVPNLLTLLRLLLAAVFFVLLEFHVPGSAGSAALLAVAAGLFIIAASTDALDGYLARLWKVESMFGRIIDPLADKILVLGAFIYLAGPRFLYTGAMNRAAGANASPGVQLVEAELSGGAGVSPAIQLSGVYPWMVIVILARELLVTAIRGQVEARGVKFGAVQAGKLKMILQTLVIPAVLLLIAFTDLTQPGWATLTRDILVWATVFITIVSGVPYITGAHRALCER